MILIVVACSFGVGIGVVGIVAALQRPTVGVSSETTPTTRLFRVEKRLNGRESTWNTHSWITKIGLPLVSALIVGTVTRWPVAALLAAVATYPLPARMRSRTAQDLTRRTEAVAVWTELLRDTLTASAG